ncbi:hypothetical protein MKX03_008106 [Papaver bracteatum]|nr:hypothetical protein MKX03_008106 [Papaver bracteatum]
MILSLPIFNNLMGVLCLFILVQRRTSNLFIVLKAKEYIVNCQPYDGGFLLYCRHRKDGLYYGCLRKM